MSVDCIGSGREWKKRLYSELEIQWINQLKITTRIFFILGLEVLQAMASSELGHIAMAQGRFGELVLSFNEKKGFHFEENKIENKLILHLKNTFHRDLTSINNYNETVIKRILVRDLGSEGCVLEITLKDRKLKATVDELKEPYRIVVNIFDYDYKQQRDPENGIQILNGNQHLNTLPHENYPEKLNLKKSQFDVESYKKGSPDSYHLKVSNRQSYELKSPNIENSRSKRRLLQPTPDTIEDSRELSLQMKETPDGRGDAWRLYPPYLYPIKTAVFIGRKDPAGWQKKIGQLSMSAAQSMAEYAFKMYTFGHEKKALVGYQKVLHQEPSIYEEDVLHLWAFAESHLGQGNLQLADGYFQSLISRFPESPLSKYAYIRRLDIKSIRLIDRKKMDKLASLANQLSKLDTLRNAELRGQKAIRLAYWTKPFPKDLSQEIPYASPSILSRMENVFEHLESRKTAFLIASILLKNGLQREEKWRKKTALLASSYFKLYEDDKKNFFKNELVVLYKQRISEILVNFHKQSQFKKTIEILNSLPKSLKKSITSEKNVSWSIAESYRKINNLELSIEYYKKFIGLENAGVRKFKASFWYAVLTSRIVKSPDNSENSINKLKDEIKQSDKLIGRVWDKLGDDEKNEIRLSFKSSIEKLLDEDILLVNPTKIALSSWIIALEEKEKIDKIQEKNSWITAYPPSSSTVKILSKIIEKFRKIGLSNERKVATRLLQKISPEEIKDDREAHDLWKNHLIDFAEELRKKNEYLEAGRLYTYTAEKSIDSSDRAEGLYKGGLLLYRSGRREEAIESLTKASQDGDNIFYANLAKERLIQLNR